MKKVHVIPDINNIDKSMEIASNYNAAFEYNDFYLPTLLDDQARLKEIIDFYKKLPRDRKDDTLHGAFLDITVHSSDPLIKAVSEKRIRQSLDIASELGVKGVIFHTNYMSNFKIDYYEDGWVKENSIFWQKMLAEYPKMSIYIENMFDEEPDLLVRLMETVPEKERFGICFDYAHACAFGNDIDRWTSSVAPYVKHMHINDNNLVNDLHLPVKDGEIDWQKYNSFFTDYNLEPSVLVEVKSIENQIKSLEVMKADKIYPLG